MKKGGIGGSNTQTGILFEDNVDITKYLDEKVDGYRCEPSKDNIGVTIYFKEKVVASSYKKHELYKFLKEQGIIWEKILSSKILPDDAIYVIKNNTLFIIEIKFQQVAGSTDEKLQTCDYKLRQYKSLFAQLNYEVKYIYILNDWFKQERYRDVLSYIISVGCQYYFNYLPLQKIGLPLSSND